MASLRGSSSAYDVGSVPPQVTWTVVRGDTAAFKVYVTDDLKQPLTIGEWAIRADIKRGTALVTSLAPEATDEDTIGEFTVKLTAVQSRALRTGDLFDIQLSDPTRVWTVIKGSFIIIDDVTV
jgi:hypothetical protein